MIRLPKFFLLGLICAGMAALPAIAQLMPNMPLRTATPMAAPATAVPTPAATGSGAVQIPTPAGLMDGAVADDTYKLRVGDTVSFQIEEDRLLRIQLVPTSLVVMDSGEVDVPYIGRVTAVDKTCKQLGEDIKKSLEKDYYKQATVTLSLNVANRLLGRVYVWGQVRNQGAIDLLVNEQFTVGKAVMRAGGFADFANKRKVRVVRAGTDASGKSQTFTLDMTAIMDNGDISKDIVLQPNDLIIVPSRLINF